MLSGISEKTYELLKAYSFEVKNMSPNSVGNRIKHLKGYMNYLVKRKYTSDLSFREFKKPNSAPVIVSLMEEELKQFYYFDFSLNKRLERVRDLFVLGCSTGLRYSDLVRIKPEHVRKDHLEIDIKKTKDQLIIPLNAFSKAILDKYSNRIPAMSNQKMNDYLREAAKEAKLDELRRVAKYSNQRIQYESKPLHEIITSHHMRKTFVTLCLEKGIAMKDVMKWSNHKDLRSFTRYTGTNDKRLKEQMQKNWTL